MRYKFKPNPDDGSQRTKTWFAIIPVKIDDEIRWLEKVKVKQTWYWYGDNHGWVNSSFID